MPLFEPQASSALTPNLEYRRCFPRSGPVLGWATPQRFWQRAVLIQRDKGTKGQRDKGGKGEKETNSTQQPRQRQQSQEQHPQHHTAPHQPHDAAQMRYHRLAAKGGVQW
jgi:hypothetical protein